MELLYLSPALLEPDPDGVRTDTGDVAGLAATMADRGVLQPLGVVALANGRYRIVYGGRRHAAALQLGLAQIPCLVLQQDGPDLLTRQVIENLQRQDLNDIDQGRAFARLREQVLLQGTTASEAERDESVGRMIGIGGRTVRRYLGLLELADDVQELIRQGELNVTQAQHLRRVTNRQTQRDLARFAVAEGMSAAEISRLVAYFAANPNLSLEAALAALEQGAELRTRATEERSDVPMPRTAATTGEAEEDVDWGDEEQSDDDSVELDGFKQDGADTIENQPQNKARVFRIRTLDQMVDESDRLTRALHEGDLEKWVEKDDGAAYKVRLLLRQLETLTRALRELARSHRLPIEDD